MTTSQQNAISTNGAQGGSNGNWNGLAQKWGRDRALAPAHDGQPVRLLLSRLVRNASPFRKAAVMGAMAFGLAACTQTSTSELLAEAARTSATPDTQTASTQQIGNDAAGVASLQKAQQKLIEQQMAFIEQQRQKQLALFEENRKKFEAQVAANASAGDKKADVKPQTQTLALAARPGATPPREKTQTAKKKSQGDVKKASVGTTSRAPAGNIVMNARWDCVPSKLKNVINEVSRRYGKVTVNSTHRSKKHNRRIGGARNSYHLRCQAVDFRVNASGKAVLKYLRAHPHVGGLKRYRSGFFHIDTGPRRTWRG